MKQLAAVAAGLCLLAFSPTPSVAATNAGGWTKFVEDKAGETAARPPQPALEFPELWLLDRRFAGRGPERDSNVNASCVAGPLIGNATGPLLQRG